MAVALAVRARSRFRPFPMKALLLLFLLFLFIPPVYSITNGLHSRHTFSDEFAAALRRHGYTVTADGMVNATEVSP